MEHEPIESPIGVKKNDLYKAYQELLAEFRAIEPTPSTVEAAEKAAKAAAVKAAEDLDVASVRNTILGLVDAIDNRKDEYEKLVKAISVAKEELANVHGVTAEANSAAAMVRAKEQLVAELTDKADSILQDAKEKAGEIVGAAREEADNLHTKAAEAAAEMAKTQKRQEEEWTYTFARQKQAKVDEVQDEINRRVKALKEQEEAIAEREAEADKLEAKVTEAENKLEALNDEIDQRIEIAVAEAEEKAKRSADTQKTIIESHYKSQLTVKDGEIASLKERVEELRTRLDKAESLVNNANERVSTIATESMRARADVATISKVAEVAASGGSKK